MTVNQFQYSKDRRIYSYIKTKTTDLQVELFVNKIYIMCISPLYACQQFFRWWNATRDHHQSKTQSLWNMKYYKGTHKCWISFKGRGVVVFHTDTLYKLFIKLQLPLLATIECFCSKWFCSLRKYHRSRCLSVRIRHFRLTREINQLRQEIPVVKRCF